MSAGLLENLRSRCAGFASELCEGICVDTDKGRVLLTPQSGFAGISVRGEAASAEMAEELCADFEQIVREADTLEDQSAP